MPFYEYTCEPCLIVYKVRHSINEAGPTDCPKCKSQLRKVITAPSVIGRNFSSPTAAKYSTMTDSEELAREKDLQKVFDTIWMPAAIKHNPWEEEH